MNKILSLLISILCFAQPGMAQQVTETIVLNENDIQNGYFVKRIPLQHYARPTVNIHHPVYKKAQLIQKTDIPQSTTVNVLLGKEKKKPFALLFIPAYRNGENAIEQLASFTLEINEKPQVSFNQQVFKTTAAGSVLASGTWYKISIKDRGIYKLDYNFIKDKLGVNPSTINPANIRIYGNGGTMLSENNAVPRFADLKENAIQVMDGNDGSFDASDYLLFYANGPMAWNYDNSSQTFVHRKNIYEDKSYYFVNFDLGTGLRIAQQTNAPAATTSVTSYNDYQVHEEDSINIGKFGKEWWGEAFGSDGARQLSKTFSFDLGNVTDSVVVALLYGSRAGASGNTFTVSLNGQQLDKFSFAGLDLNNHEYNHISTKFLRQKLNGITGATTVSFQYFQAVSGTGYVNYIEWNTRRQLALTNGMTSFRDIKSLGAGNVAGYRVENANNNLTVWDITEATEPVKMTGTLAGSSYSFTQNAETLHEFIGFDGSVFLTPTFKEKVINQNLHGEGFPDFIIVTHPNFIDAANKLADFHRKKDNMSVLVATIGQIYNEFSSGSQDISAIRDFARYFYENAGDDTSLMPKHLLLLGDASYDYKDYLSNNTNFVPTFETSESNYGINGYCSDDFYSFLDDNENSEDASIANTMDMGVGRLPVGTKEEAVKVVDKIINYASASSLGPWRLSTTIMTDWKLNEDGHFYDGETMSTTINGHSNLYNQTKVYVAAIPMTSTPGGTRSPEANKIINDQIAKGTFLMNYSGHGSIYTLSNNRILSQDDFNNWTNINKLPIMVTATCDFSRFDNPEAQSAGEKLMVKANGGAIALLTTTQLVYQGLNHAMNKQFLNAQFQKYDGRWLTLGEAFQRSKNVSYINPMDPFDLTNFRKFALLGDPALTPAFPIYNVTTDSLVDGNSLTAIDSMKALGSYMLKGSVKDEAENILTNFNGNVYVTIYDKPRTQTSIYGSKKLFQVQNNIIFKGKATVTAGKFSIAFITPKDLNYDFGKGKVTYYVENGITDGAGTDTNMVVGGFSDRPIVDNKGPQVRPFINDTLFRDGGITGSNTSLHVRLYDAETGINVSGNSVGHDLIAVLDGDVANPFILNDYYESAANDYTNGMVNNFPVTGLADGKHNLRVKAWDMNNNSGEGEVNFVVINGQVVQVQNLLNYPNPFSDLTHFVFDHNHPNESLDVTISVFNTTGALVRTLKQNFFTPTGSRSAEITWDGTSDLGAKLPSGVYVYRLNLATAKGIQSSAYEKLVLLR
jgi:hypothetical protein